MVQMNWTRTTRPP
uniref:Uncharacterized protein MANES_07G019200 n=1 Tax=Rhizophora mucronata TaxID=61149 RepID=A0A2P2PTA5_RHIMU